MSRLDEIKARAEQVHWTSTSIEQAMARMASSAADVPWLVSEVARLTAERDALTFQTFSLEEVMDDIEGSDPTTWERLRAALADSEADTSDVDVCSGDADCTSALHVHGCFADTAGPCTDPDEHQPTGQEAAPDAGHKCEPCYSRSECGQCGWQEQWCVTCSRQMCGCATDTTNQEVK